MTRFGIALVLATFCGFAQAQAASSAASAQTALDPALPPDPQIVATLEALGDRSSAVLAPLKVVGPINALCKEHYMDKRGPNGRDYTNKAAWMPERRRALFCGANHGSPHRVNDAWEYDLLSNTWALLFAPDPHNAAGVMEIKEGEIPGSSEKVKFVQTQRGGPTHYGHTWWAFCYHPQMKAGLWMNVPIGTSSGAYIEKTTGSKEGIYRGPPMWAFYPAEKQWKLVLSPGPYPRIDYAKQMEYVPDLGGALFLSGSWNAAGAWLYDHGKNAWTQLAKPDKEAPDNESLTCYDPSRKIVIAQSHHRSTHHYDLATHKWTKVLDPGKESAEAPLGHDARSVMYFDTVSKQALLFESKTMDTVWAYDPDAKKWTPVNPSGPVCPEGGRTIGYFDEARNVLVISRGANTWVYRHQRAGK